ncbi:M20/M25/M40 family metallo-hydrolase [Gillisia sp. Q332]|uniref:M20/M25/M40 family metallo-hydrolase n=1 Tax=Gillisia xinjiangensis TaxID=3384765 RepID=UPI00391CE379
MRKNIIKISVFAGLITFGACNSAKNSNSENVIISENIINTTLPDIAISEASVKEKLEFLASDDLRGRQTGTEGINKAAGYIEAFFKKNNIKPYYETYRDSFEVSDRTGFNVIGFMEGNDPELKKEFIILGAHYDHIGIEKAVDNDSIANGANDNAAGTVAVMELAEQFAKLKANKRSILFILFSAEEMGLQGAKHISKRLKSEDLDLYAMVNFEMIGVPMQGKDHLAYLTGYENSNLAEKFNEYSEAEILGFLPQAKEYNLFKRSDNYSFYQEFKVPAQTISTFDFTNYEYYHHVSDEAEKMDIAHMADLIEKVIPGLLKMTNTSEKEIKLN